MVISSFFSQKIEKIDHAKELISRRIGVEVPPMVVNKSYGSRATRKITQDTLRGVLPTQIGCGTFFPSFSEHIPAHLPVFWLRII